MNQDQKAEFSRIILPLIKRCYPPMPYNMKKSLCPTLAEVKALASKLGKEDFDNQVPVKTESEYLQQAMDMLSPEAQSAITYSLPKHIYVVATNDKSWPICYSTFVYQKVRPDIDMAMRVSRVFLYARINEDGTYETQVHDGLQTKRTSNYKGPAIKKYELNNPEQFDKLLAQIHECAHDKLRHIEDMYDMATKLYQHFADFDE